LLTLPEFVDLFSAEAPAAGVELTVSTLTVVFAQLTGVDELCARLGDARAVHPLVRALDAVRAAIAAHEGAAFCTMGETVMACFTSPAQALAAVAEIAAHLAHAADHAGMREFAVRAGIGQGACLLVRSGDRLELFGGTVGAAQRRMSRATAGEIAVQAPLLEHAEIARWITRGSMETTGVRVIAA
jgi:class 3 adenylate cyclase